MHMYRSIRKRYTQQYLPRLTSLACFRWFLVGPKRSGTSVHIDPLGTSAWNTVVSGRKLWVLFPPHVDKNVAKGKDVIRPGEDDEPVRFVVQDSINLFLFAVCPIVAFVLTVPVRTEQSATCGNNLSATCEQVFDTRDRKGSRVH